MTAGQPRTSEVLDVFDAACARHAEHMERLHEAHRAYVDALASGSNRRSPVPRAPAMPDALPGGSHGTEGFAQAFPTDANRRSPVPRAPATHGLPDGSRGTEGFAEAILPAGPLGTDVFEEGIRIGEARTSSVSWTLDPADAPWLGDHRPTYGVSVLPAAWLFDRLASVSAAGRNIVGLDDARVIGWVPIEEPTTMRVDARPLGAGRIEATLSVFRRSARAALSRFEPRARAIVLVGDGFATEVLEPLEPLDAPEPLHDPYDNVFLGPAFRLATSVVIGANGATSLVDPSRSGLPRGALHVGLLDASLHATVPRAQRRWHPELDFVCLPSELTRLRLFGALPERGLVRVELRTRGARDDGRRTFAHVRYFVDRQCVLALDSTQVLFPSRVPPDRNERFMRDLLPCPGVTTARHDGITTRMSPAELVQLDWLPGTLARIYGHAAAEPIDRRVLDIALKDHGAQRLGVHPRDVETDHERGTVSANGSVVPVIIERGAEGVVVRDRRPPP